MTEIIGASGFDDVSRDQAIEGLGMLQTLAERLEPEIRKLQSPLGKLGLDPILDERRLKYAAPDAIWQAHASFDKILVWQIIEDEETDGKVAGTSLYAPATAKRRNREETPRGLLCSAGLKAMDVLHSNGMRVGDIVHFVRLAPYRRPVFKHAGLSLHVMCLNVGDIVDNEDLAKRLRSGEMKIVMSAEGRHGIEGLTDPQQPWSGEDMI